MTSTYQRRSSDVHSLPRKVATVISHVLRLTNRRIQALLRLKVSGGHRDVSPQSLALLREHILGSNKESVVDVFGIPPKVQLPDGTVAQSDQPMDANTWYFPLDPARGTILVVQFEDGHAADAQFVDAPLR